MMVDLDGNWMKSYGNDGGSKSYEFGDMIQMEMEIFVIYDHVDIIQIWSRLGMEMDGNGWKWMGIRK